MRFSHPILGAAAGGLALLLAACGQSAEDEIRLWMVEQKNTIAPRVEPIAEPKRFVAQSYGGESALSPFSSEKLFSALRSEGASASDNSLLRPELNRRKEPLEFVPLDSMTMVGLLDQGRRKVALVRVDKLLYQVGVGQYLGQNYGRITRIADNELTLREIVQDAAGDWVERQATLQLQEETRK
ncbi:MAG: hypothetical protein RJA36_961 [Pseudomonadota bacterium]|jgi:type IV pilus assembly protein PilP